jgi:hypothetical protein
MTYAEIKQLLVRAERAVADGDLTQADALVVEAVEGGASVADVTAGLLGATRRKLAAHTRKRAQNSR